MKKKIYTVNFISGGGSTNLAILEAQKPGGKLHELVETVAIISSNPKAKGKEKAVRAGFPRGRIYDVDSKSSDFEERLLDILDMYNPDFFHQLGWEPWTPPCVIESYDGLNQHLGPGGRFMYYERRIYAQMWFCKKIGEKRPIPIFCQYVHKVYDEGNVIAVRFEDFQEGETVEKIAKRLLPIEHEVQIEGLLLLATGEAKPIPVPRVYETDEEKAVMDQAIYAAKDQYPKLMKS
jgi:folate-dependent phosphoribosylglycinamide formyltransferase PurN